MILGYPSIKCLPSSSAHCFSFFEKSKQEKNPSSFPSLPVPTPNQIKDNKKKFPL